MRAETTFTLIVSSISLMITLITTFIATFVIINFSKIRTDQQHDDSVSNYFRFTSSLSLIFAALNTAFNTVYCVWLVFDPQYDDIVFYTQHISHIQRITSTVCWYISKTALIWLINGRLYFVFKGKMLSDLQSNKKTFLFINIITTFTTPILLVSAYYFVYTNQLIYAEFAFNSFRLFLILSIIIILCMFSKRLLFLSIQFEMLGVHQNEMNRMTKSELTMQHKFSNSQHTPNSPNCADTNTVRQNRIKIQSHAHNSKTKNSNAETPQTSTPNSPSIPRFANNSNSPNFNLQLPPNSPSISRFAIESRIPSTECIQSGSIQLQSDRGIGFINITTRNAVLVVTVAISILFVFFSFMAFRFMIGEQTRISLLLPMNVAAVDSLITSVAILCLFRFGDNIYPKICKFPNVCFKIICIRFAKKTLLNRVVQ